MPIERIDSKVAFDRLKHNPASRWPDGRKRSTRLEGIADVSVSPGFTFKRKTPVMTIGSCFARNIETYLQTLGFDLPMLGVAIPPEERGSATANDILNKYSVHSIENEIRWAFEGLDMAPEKLLLETEDGLWHDPQLAPNLIPAPFERVMQRREDVMAATRQLSRCGLVIITLGLAESWFDLETGLYLNGALPASTLKRHSQRFTLDVLAYEDILASLERIRDLIQKYGPTGIKMLVTTSPVPFKATFSGQDALVANCYSKSVQRAVCGAFAARHADVDYFPSYEVVTLTERGRAFETDNIHVRDEVVKSIMSTVIRSYCPEIPAEKSIRIEAGRSAEDQRTFADKLFKRQDYNEAALAYEALLTHHGRAMEEQGRATVLFSQAVSHLRAGQDERGLGALRAALGETPLDPDIHHKIGLVYERQGELKLALTWFGHAHRLAPTIIDHAWLCGQMLDRLDRSTEARYLYHRVLAIDPGHASARAALDETPETSPAPTRSLADRLLPGVIRSCQTR